MNPRFVLIFCAYFACCATGQRAADINLGAGDLSIQLLNRHVSGDKNTVHSAYSISSALGMVLMGARGKTSEAIRSTMGLGSLKVNEIKEGFRSSVEGILEDNDYVLKSANRIYVDEAFPIRKSFEKDVNDIFLACIHNADFGNHSLDVQAKINLFVRNRTEGHIPEILSSPLSPSTVMVLINAVYFKATWQDRLKNLQLPDEFNNHTCNSPESSVTQQKALWIGARRKFKYIESTTLQAKLVELPYSAHENSTQKASMIVILPDEEHKCDIPAWVKQYLKWSSVVDAVKSMKHVELELSMPQTDIEAEFELSKDLSEMGMAPAFASSADFSGIVDGSAAGIHINRIIHRTKIMMDENGTEAASASAVDILRKAFYSDPPIKEMFIDRSFVAMIVVHQSDGSLVPLFTSVVNKIGAS